MDIESLLIQVEQAWEQGRGYERMVVRLACEHPEHWDALRSFLGALIQTELAPPPDPDISSRSAAALAYRLDAMGERSMADAIRESAGLIHP